MPVLSEARVRTAKALDKAYKLYDERGLYLKVETSGSRLWRFKYHFGGKERLLALGAYPDMSLKIAREERDNARRVLAGGIDASAQKQEAKAAEAITFAGVAAEWLELHRKRFAPATYEKAVWTFNDLVNPHIGSRPIASITAPELLAMLRRLEKRGKHETAHRMKQPGVGNLDPQIQAVENPFTLTLSPWNRDAPGFTDVLPWSHTDFAGSIAFGVMVGGVFGAAFCYFYRTQRAARLPPETRGTQ